MNRRHFILTNIAFLATGPSASVAVSQPHPAALQETLVRTKRLGPANRKVTFSGGGLFEAKGQLTLRPLLNGLWIERVSWTERGGAVHRFPVKRNVPRNMLYTFPGMVCARRIEIDLTCLPLAAQQTVIELTAVSAAVARPSPL